MNNIFDKLEGFFRGKRVLILGFGREGRSTLSILRKINCTVGIADIKAPDENETAGCELYCGENYLDCLDSFDIIMKAPGVALLDKVSDTVKAKITSQTDLLLRFCENSIIGITGTKGKSTTSSLIYHILKSCGKDALLIGNIGVPPLERIDDFREGTVIVCEMSCHQLEYVKASPHTAVYLNVFEEHLDHYTGFEAYKAAKENIYRYQTENDTLIINKALVPDDTKARIITASLDERADIFPDETVLHINGLDRDIKDVKTRLLGRHNLYNIGIAVCVSMLYGCEAKQIFSAVGTFRGLEHRLENVGTVGSVQYINDSISTCPSTAIAAVKAFDKVDTIIIGGMDRGINYDELVSFLNGSDIENVILLPDSGYRIAPQLDTSKRNIFRARDLADAVSYAKKVTKVRCLLSPAAASYGFYKNFEERGKHFRELVLGQ